MADEGAGKVVSLNLRKDLVKHPKWKRRNKIISLLKEKISKQAKSGNVKIAQKLNEKVWKSSEKNNLVSLRVRISKQGKDSIKAELME